MATPELELRTLYVLDDDGHITSTREPGTRRPPAFALVRGAASCAWAVRADVPSSVAAELGQIAQEEPACTDLRQPPVHADRYISLVGGRIEFGPAYAFPDSMAQPADVVAVEKAKLLERYFADLAPELRGRAPFAGVLEDGDAVSVCYCARRSGEAAEAGLITAETYRGRGLGPRVTAAWALAIRASGRIPLYSTAWTNLASLAVARKLGLIAYASDWSLAD